MLNVPSAGSTGLSPWQAARRYLRSHYLARRHRLVLRDVETYCLFIGHARAGGSLIGAMVDAHADAVIADEVDVLEPMRRGWSRERILGGLIASSNTQARWRHTVPGSGRTLPNAVPGQWQGRFATLRVLGSSRAGPTTRDLATHPSLLPAWRSLLGDVRLRAIHVVRNPYDAISQMMLRSGRSFDSGIERYFSNATAVMRVRSMLDPHDVLLVRHERLMAEPAAWLRRCCEHLGLHASDEYVAAASAVVHDVVHHRHEVPWSTDHIAQVARQIERFPALAGYAFDETDPATVSARTSSRRTAGRTAT